MQTNFCWLGILLFRMPYYASLERLAILFVIITVFQNYMNMKNNCFYLVLIFMLGTSILCDSMIAQEKVLRIIAIGAHPDDCDSKFGGAAALFAEMGHQVKFLALTSGDAGHQSQGEAHSETEDVLKLQKQVSDLALRNMKL